MSSEPAPVSGDSPFIATGEATAILPARESGKTPITVIGTPDIRGTFDELCIRQALNARSAPGVSDVVLNPDAHCGYGAPIGCVLVSPTHIYPGPVGVDIKCSMSLLQLDVPADAIADVRTRRALIDAIIARTPTGAGKDMRSVQKSRRISADTGRLAAVHGASEEVCRQLGIPAHWAGRCEDAFHTGHDGTHDALAARLDVLQHGHLKNLLDKTSQLGSYGGGNHFGECEIVRVGDSAHARRTAAAFSLKDNHVAFLSHCGSRGFGFQLANHQFRALQDKFSRWSIPLPGDDRELVYAPLGTMEADAYIDDMSLGANFATVNHMLINALVLEAFAEVLPGAGGSLVYFISHNIARRELLGGKMVWVHRKGATRAFPAGHPGLRNTAFADIGHPILLPGNPQAGSVIMVARADAAKSCFSVNHGAGRRLGRRAAMRQLDQKVIDESFAAADIITNCRNYPRDEAPDAYKDFNEVLRSVTKAGLADEVARLHARFVIKDADKADD